MDLWVVAAAAGAGYIAKYWQNFSTGDKESSDELFGYNPIRGQANSSSFFEQIREKTCPFRILAQKRAKRDGFSQQDDDVLDKNGNFSGNVGAEEHGVDWFRGELFQEHMESVSADRSNNGSFPDYDGVDEYNVHWLGGVNVSERKELADPDSSAFRFNKSKSLSNRRRRGYFVRPLNSLESCIASQICNEHEKVEEYVYSSTPSPAVPVLKPLLVTDGSRVISRGSIDSSGVRGNGETNKPRDFSSEENKACTRALATSNNNDSLSELPLKPSNHRVSRGPFHSPGPHDGMVLFFLGISIGILSVVMASKREVDKLSKQLKQAENLVQDLREELEMKDVLSVRELADEASQPQRVADVSQYHWESSTPSSQQRVDEVSGSATDGQTDQRVENPELNDEIEAELLAELERLELSLKASNLERIRDYAKLDADIEAAMAQGTKLNVLSGRTEGGSESNNEGSITGDDNYQEPADYAVSPRELSLRLHEVIEKRLEARINELEAALQSSESRMHFQESQRRFTFGEAEFSSTPQSPVYMSRDSDEDEPLVINLAGNALEAYNEAYAEMLSITAPEKDTVRAVELPPSHKKSFDIPRRPKSSLHVEVRSCEDQTSRSLQSSETFEGEEEEDDDEDMLLIKRIVEKRRSTANLLVYDKYRDNC